MPTFPTAAKLKRTLLQEKKKSPQYLIGLKLKPHHYSTGLRE